MVAPPSSRGVLGDYCWELSSIPGEAPLAECPQWLVGLLLHTPTQPVTVRQPDAVYPPADIVPIEAGCAWMRRCRDEAPAISQWDWRQQLSILGRCGDGEALAHERSQADPRRYDARLTAETLRHALGRAGPVRCAYVESKLGFSGCAGCPHHGAIVSPIVLGRQTARTRAYAERTPPPPGEGGDGSHSVADGGAPQGVPNTPEAAPHCRRLNAPPGHLLPRVRWPPHLRRVRRAPTVRLGAATPG